MTGHKARRISNGILAVLLAASVTLTGCNVDVTLVTDEDGNVQNVKIATDEASVETIEAPIDMVLTDLPTEWDLTELYADEDAFEADMKRAEELIPEMEKFRGKLNNVEGILDSLEDPDAVELTEIIARAGMYAMLLSALDSTDPWAAQVTARLDGVKRDAMLATAYQESEMMAIPLEERIQIFSDERLAPYRYFLRQFTDPDRVVLSEEANRVRTIMKEERSTNNTHDIFDYVELPVPTFTYPDGTQGTLTDTEFSRVIQSDEYDHEFRKELYSLRNSMRRPYANTYASLLDGRIREYLADARLDGFDSTLEAALNETDINEEVYYRIIDFAHSMLPKIQEYYRARKQLLGLDEMMPCDLYISVTDYSPRELTYEEAANLGREAISVWGDEYLETFDKIIKSPHLDVYPTPTKTAGAFSLLSGNETMPFALYNYDGLESYASTLVHEMGHSVYSEFSAENQNLYNCNPDIFTQEVASLSNELMFHNNMIGRSGSDAEKIYWMDSEIELFIGSIIRQCMLSEFEDYCHKTVEGGGSLQAGDLSAKWMELQKIYYGDDVTVPEDSGIEWARVDHYYSNYYVYKYATSMAYAASVCNMMNEDPEGESAAYLDFLKAGRSADPATLLAIAGVDPMDDATYEAAGELISSLIDEFIETTGVDVSEQKSPADTSVMKPWINSNIYGIVTDDVTAELKDDFYLNVNHDWLRDATFRPGYASESPMFDASDIIKERCMDMLCDDSITGRDAEMVREHYRQFLDWDARNEVGVEPLRPFAEELAKVKDIDELSDFLLSDMNITYGTVPFKINIGYDPADSSKYNVDIDTTGLTLSDSAEYSQMTEYGRRLKDVMNRRDTYALVRFGYSESEAQKIFDDMYDFESKLAPFIMTTLEKNDADAMEKMVNPVTMDDIREISPNLPLADYMEKLGYAKSKLINLDQPEWLRGLDSLYNEENFEGIRAYILVTGLSADLGNLDEDAYRTVVKLSNELRGVTEESSDEDSAYETTRARFEMQFDRLYIEHYLSDEIRQEIRQLCQDAIDTYYEMLDQEDWLSDETREEAKNKLRHMKINAVYPDKWRDDSMFNVTPKEEGGSYYQNVIDYRKAVRERNLTLINTTVDRDIWMFDILDNNAFYNVQDNSINIIPGFFCKSTYDSSMSIEEKYGALGTVIGHEISHAFDTTGAQFDADGNFANWWTDEDLDAFRKRAAKLIAYYDEVEAFDDGTPYRGQMVQTEAIADMAGMKCMLKMAGKIDGFDYDRFFRAFEYMWAESSTLSILESQALGDVHPLSYLRGNVTVQQFDEFYDTYGVKEGDGMYLAPEDRILVW